MGKHSPYSSTGDPAGPVCLGVIVLMIAAFLALMCWEKATHHVHDDRQVKPRPPHEHWTDVYDNRKAKP